MKKFTLAFLLLTASAYSTPLYYLATGQTGAQTQIDINHTSSWLLTPNVNFDFGGGVFTMKDGTTTTDNIILSIYKGTNNLGILLDVHSVTNTAFCGQVTNCGSYAYHQMFFNAPVTLVAGTTYFVNLTSPAADVQSKAYFIKNDSFFISDQAGNAINPQPAGFGPDFIVPEPQSQVLILIGLALIGAYQLRASRRRSQSQVG